MPFFGNYETQTIGLYSVYIVNQRCDHDLILIVRHSAGAKTATINFGGHH